MIRVLPQIIMLFLGLLFLYRIKKSRTDLGENCKVYDDLSQIDNQEFCLLLRSFSKENQQILLPFYQTSFLSKENMPTIDVFLYSKLKDYLPIIKIANPESDGTQLSVDQLVLDEEWKTKVASLIDSSKHIIIHPTISDGLIWELDYIFNHDYITKVMFVITKNPYKSGEKRRNNHFFNLLQNRFGVSIKHQKNLMFFVIKNQQTQSVINVIQGLKQHCI